MNKAQYLQFLEERFEIVEEVNEKTCFFATTQFISEQTQKKNTSVNHHLNNLFKEGQLVRINTKPVYYLPKRALTTFLNRTLPKDIYESFEELLNEQSSVFDALIGGQYSLSHVINQGKIALSYPPNGMPFLLTGPTG